ncbi:MAG: tetratricopeptide repeat protein [Phycisphaerae bacterium]|nr:tetratricopeptide repeat protein [Phycisphaerae bacterium]
MKNKIKKPQSKNFIFYIYLLLAIATFVCFWQVRNFDFTNYDDDLYVSENPRVPAGLTIDNIVWAFTTGDTGYWHPLTWISFMLDCQLFGPDPGRIHLVNLLLHIANTLLLFTVLKKMIASLWPSAFVAALFAVHPMHVESVAWIAERKDVLSTFFWFLTLAAYAAYVKRSSVFRYIITFAIFVLAVLTKPMVVTLPFVLLLLDYWPLNRFGSVQSKQTEIPQKSFCYLILEKIPFFVLSAALSAVTFLIQRNRGIAPDIDSLSLKSRAANALLSYSTYIGKMFWPRNLAVFYPYDTGSFVPFRVVLSASVLLIISILVVCWARRKKYLFTGWFWFLGTLVPVIGIIQSGAQSFADRYTYISYIGLFIMLVWALPGFLSWLPQRKFVLAVSIPIVLAVLGTCTYLQTGYWKNSITLFSHALDVTKNNYLAHTGLADELGAQGKRALAIEHYEKALQIQPTCAFTHNNLGLALAQQNNREQAIVHFSRAVELMPHLDKARGNLAKTLAMTGRFNEALDQLRTAIQLRPNYPDFMNDFAFLTAAHPELEPRDMNEAILFARRACELTNYKKTAYLSTLAVTYSAAGRLSEAVKTIETALKLEPDSVVLRNGLGDTLFSQGKFREAIAQMKSALEIEQGNPDVKNNLAWIFATCPDPNIRNPSEAIRLAKEACIATNYKTPGKLDTLAAAFASAGRFDEAIEVMKKALSLIGENDKPILEQFQNHLDLYRSSKPYISTPQENKNTSR